MKPFVRAGSLFALLAIAAGALFAQQPEPAQQPQPAPEAQPQPAPEAEPGAELFFAGVVTKVDAKAGTITVEEAGRTAEQPQRRTMTFRVGPEAEITRNENPVELEAIEVGAPVSLTYERSGDQNLIRTIQVLTTPT